MQSGTKKTHADCPTSEILSVQFQAFIDGNIGAK